MSRKQTLLRIMLPILVLVPTVLFAAGIVTLPKTGQVTCYDDLGTAIPCAGTGEDGENQAGAPWPSPRFTDFGDGSVLDHLTGLMWTRDTNLMAARDPGFDNDDSPGDGRVLWAEALDYLTQLNSEAFLGYTDWRLPNILELESLLDAETNSPALPEGHLFDNVQTTGHWTGTTTTADPTSAWVVNMGNGTLYYSFKESRKRNVWPVRLAQGAVSGKITHNGNNLENVTVTLSGDTVITSATDNEGTYTFLGLSEGIYQVTPSLQEYTFSPGNLAVTINGLPVFGRDFTATCPDGDTDGLCDFLDNCPGISNPDQKDCNGDAVGDLCDPDPAPPEICDGMDNNCDGVIDEGVTNLCGTCGPEPVELCDGMDNDCDGSVDEDVTNLCGTCGTEPEEVCDGIDNDCDGSVDEDVTNLCGTCGTEPEEVCDGTDNDCDGSVDEDLTRLCVTACGQGIENCIFGVWVDCNAPNPAAEICDGADNNCDGVTDEGCDCVTGQTRPCGTDTGECVSGTQNCVDDLWETDCSGALGPETEICGDLLDNDCDGQVDEDCAGGEENPDNGPPGDPQTEDAQPIIVKKSGGGGCAIHGNQREGEGSMDMGYLILMLFPLMVGFRKILP